MTLGRNVQLFLGGEAMSFAIYLIGYAIFIVGLAVGAHMMHMPPRWIGVGVLIFAGLGILKAVSSTRQRDPN
jgi:threonine/homoserine/homoserine lactone efflux protein